MRISNYLKEVLARFKGDADAVIAAKNERKGNSAFKGQIAALNAKLVDDESAVEDRVEAYKNALYPTTLISDNQSYVRGVVQAKEALDNAKATLESTKKSVAFFEGVLKSEWDTLVDPVEA